MSTKHKEHTYCTLHIYLCMFSSIFVQGPFHAILSTLKLRSLLILQNC